MIKGIEMNPKQWTWRMDWCKEQGLSPANETVWIASGEAYLKENANSGYPLLGDVRAVITEMLLPNISPDKFSGEGSVMNALRNSYIDTYNNTIKDVLKKLSEHFA